MEIMRRTTAATVLCMLMALSRGEGGLQRAGKDEEREKQQGLDLTGTFNDNCINSGELTGRNFGGEAKSCCRDTLERQQMQHTVVELLEKENVIGRICIFPPFSFFALLNS